MSSPENGHVWPAQCGPCGISCQGVGKPLEEGQGGSNGGGQADEAVVKHGEGPEGQTRPVGHVCQAQGKAARGQGALRTGRDRAKEVLEAAGGVQGKPGRWGEVPGKVRGQV